MKPLSLLSLNSDKPWIILGKGPTFDKISNLNLEDFNTLALNHVAELIPCTIGHFIDSEVISKKFIDNSKHIVCPVFPHKWNRATGIPAKHYFYQYENSHQILEKLYCYNCSTYKFKAHHLYGDIIKAKFFSSEAAFRMLAMLGVKTINTLGIDGGNDYSEHFSHLKPLTNGRKTFDDQFNELEKITKKWELQWNRL